MVEYRIPAKRGLSFEITRGAQFDIVDPMGSQVADLVAFDASETAERFSPKYTYRREGRLRPTTGDTLYTTEGEPVLDIVADDCGVHDLLYAPCTHWVLGDYYDQHGENGCRENLADVLEPEGVGVRDLQETFNVFMNSEIVDGEEIRIAEPESTAGDTVTFEAARDALVGVTACAGASTVNAGETNPIDVRLPAESVLHTNF